MATVYIGDIPEDVRQRDVEDFFRDYKIEHVRLRDRFGFVDFRSSRDADDAVRDLDGERMLGKRVRVEISEGRRGGGGRGGGKVFLLWSTTWFVVASFGSKTFKLANYIVPKMAKYRPPL